MKAQATIRLITLPAYRTPIYGKWRLLKPQGRVRVIGDRLQQPGEPNATITEIKSTFTNSEVVMYYTLDGDAEIKKLSLV
jgi:hypothetical protein